MSKSTIRIKDKFVWKVLTYKQAFHLQVVGLFPVYALKDGTEETLVSDLEHMEELKTDPTVEFVLEVGYTDYKEVAELKELIKSHDFTYEFSDDAGRWRAGRESAQRIAELAQHVNREDFIKWWNRASPKVTQMSNK